MEKMNKSKNVECVECECTEKVTREIADVLGFGDDSGVKVWIGFCDKHSEVYLAKHEDHDHDILFTTDLENCVMCECGLTVDEADGKCNKIGTKNLCTECGSVDDLCHNCWSDEAITDNVCEECLEEHRKFMEQYAKELDDKE